MKARILITILGIGWAGLIAGQTGLGTFTNYSIKEGLSQSTVNSIFQDHNGFIWLGTSDGLNKFDGQKFTIYKTNYKDSNSLSDNGILAILSEDSDNNLWILTSDWTINKFNLRSHQIKRLSPGFDKLKGVQPIKVLYSVEEDANKNLWLSTNSGVYKYNKSTNTFKNYCLFPATDSISSKGVIIWSFVDAKGALWFTSNMGLCRYNAQADTFIHYTKNKINLGTPSANHIARLVKTPDKNTWVLTKWGLGLYNHKNDNFTSFPIPTAISSIQPEIIFRSIIADKLGNIWMGTTNGLLKFNSHTKMYKLYQHNPKINGTISDNQITKIFEDKAGYIWIGSDKGLNKYNPETDAFSNYYAEPGNPNNNFIGDILELKNNEIWITGNRNKPEGIRISRVNKNSGYIELLPENINEFSVTPNSIIQFLTTDRDGNLWLGTFGSGAIKYTPHSNKFAHYFSIPNNPNSLKANSIWGFSEDSSGNIWISMYNSIIARFDTVNKQFTNYPLSTKGGKPFTITNLVADKYGDIWIASINGGLIRFNSKTFKIKQYFHNPDDPKTISSNMVRMLTIDLSGKLWLAHAFSGVDIFDPKSETAINLKHNPTNGNSLSSDRIWNIVQDYKGNMWFAVDKAIDCYDPVKKIFTHYPSKKNITKGILTNRALCIYDDRKGNIWFGTDGGGLSKFSYSTKSFIHYTENEGLANNVIYGIVGDMRENLWLTSNRGISKFNTQNQSFTNYLENAGLQSDEFNQFAYLRSSTGQIYLGGINGFNVFSPNRITKDTIAPKTIITGLLIADKPVPVKSPAKAQKTDSTKTCNLFSDSAGYYVSSDISFAQQIILPYHAKVFTFQFAAIAFNSPEKSLFRYKMENFDDGWNYAGERNSATYTNLAPGTYIFKVSAANSDGIWNTQATELIITITPPFWKTWWFITLEIGLVIGMVWLYIVIRERNLRRSNAKLEIKVKERTHQVEEVNEELRLRNFEINKQKEEIALQAKQLATELKNQNAVSEMALLKSQINPHFLFNTLNNIYSLIYQKSEDAPSAVMKLSELMRYMVYETNTDKVPLEKEINYLKSFIELQLLRLKNKDFVSFNIEGNIYGKTIAPMLLIPFVENAFKHGNKKNENPGIIINLVIGDENLRFDVSNNYQLNGSINKDETGGIGVKNVRRRLELIHPNSHLLDISKTENQFNVHLELTLQ